MFYTGRLGERSIHWYLYLSMKEFSFYNWTTGGKPEQIQGLFLWWIVNKKRGIIKCKSGTRHCRNIRRVLDTWSRAEQSVVNKQMEQDTDTGDAWTGVWRQSESVLTSTGWWICAGLRSHHPVAADNNNIPQTSMNVIVNRTIGAGWIIQ